MKKLSLSDWRRLDKDGVIKVLPCLISIEGEDKIVMADPNEIIVLSDLHPNMRRILKAQENKARGGMPPPVKIYPYIRPEQRVV